MSKPSKSDDKGQKSGTGKIAVTVERDAKNGRFIPVKIAKKAPAETVHRRLANDRTRCPKCGEKLEDCTCPE